MDILKIIADNPALTEALREAFIKEVNTLPEGAEGFSDERLGQIARGRIEALAALNRVMKMIERLRTVPDHKPSVNRAR